MTCMMNYEGPGFIPDSENKKNTHSFALIQIRESRVLVARSKTQMIRQGIIINKKINENTNLKVLNKLSILFFLIIVQNIHHTFYHIFNIYIKD